MRSRVATLATQLLGSLLVLAVLLYDAEAGAVWAALSRASGAWLGAALLVKALTVTARELRLWVALAPLHPVGLRAVLPIGYAAGLVNNVLPARGGDLLAVGLLRQERGVPAPTGLSAVGITSLLEAGVFGLVLLSVMAAGLLAWKELLAALTPHRGLRSSRLRRNDHTL